MDAFVANSLALLTLERDAEVERSEGLVSSGQLQSVKELEAKGVCLQKLEVGCNITVLVARLCHVHVPYVDSICVCTSAQSI